MTGSCINSCATLHCEFVIPEPASSVLSCEAEPATATAAAAAAGCPDQVEVLSVAVGTTKPILLLPEPQRTGHGLAGPFSGPATNPAKSTTPQRKPNIIFTAHVFSVTFSGSKLSKASRYCTNCSCWFAIAFVVFFMECIFI